MRRLRLLLFLALLPLVAAGSAGAATLDQLVQSLNGKPLAETSAVLAQISTQLRGDGQEAQAQITDELRALLGDAALAQRPDAPPERRAAVCARGS